MPTDWMRPGSPTESAPPSPESGAAAGPAPNASTGPAPVDTAMLDGRLPPVLFDAGHYVRAHPDLAARLAGGDRRDALSHYVLQGAAEGRSPNGWFDEPWYRDHHPEAGAAIRAGDCVSGFHHFLTRGAARGLAPTPRRPVVALCGFAADEAAALAALAPLWRIEAILDPDALPPSHLPENATFHRLEAKDATPAAVAGPPRPAMLISRADTPLELPGVETMRVDAAMPLAEVRAEVAERLRRRPPILWDTERRDAPLPATALDRAALPADWLRDGLPALWPLEARSAAPFAPHRQALLPDWTALPAHAREDWREARATAAGPRVLIATTVGGLGHATALDSVLAVALTLRGARVDLLLCDGALPACQLAAEDEALPAAWIARDQLGRTVCPHCRRSGERVFAPLDLPCRRLGDLIDGNARATAAARAADVPAADIAGLTDGGLPVGEHARAGALRFFARGGLDGTPHGDAVLRRYLEASLLTAHAARRLFAEERYEVACLHHGIYAPQGVLAEAARAAGARVVTWNPGYRSNTFIFSHGETYHRTMIEEPPSAWSGSELTERQDAELGDYLTSRMSGGRDWIWFHDRPDADVAGFLERAGLDPAKPLVGLLTNVMWDAQIHFRANAFPDMWSWITATLDWFAGQPELQLLIRVHPAEVRGTLPSRQPLMGELARRYGRLPANVAVVPPEHNLNTYAAMAACNAVLLYGTKMAMELTAAGMHAVVAGEAWTRGKGISHDVSSPRAYRDLLERLPFAAPPEPSVVRRARAYCYHVFMRRMVPLPFLTATGDAPPYRLASGCDVNQFRPGRHAGLDVLCDGILRGAPFVYPAETLGLHDDA